MTDTLLAKASHIASILTPFIAIAAVVIALVQIEAGETTQRKASARDAFKEYLKLAIERPEFADARLGKLAQTENGRSSYSWFVSYFLFSAEQVYESFPDDPEWRAALSNQICYHTDYLKGAEYQKTLRAQYEPSFAIFVDTSLHTCAFR